MPNPPSANERNTAPKAQDLLSAHGRTLGLTQRARWGLIASIALASVAGCGAPDPAASRPQGKAADLGPPMSKGVIKIDGHYVLSCPALEQERPADDLYAGFQDYCNGQNERMKEEGYPSCRQGFCAETWTSHRGGSRHSLVLKLAQAWPDSNWAISLTFETRLGGSSSNGERLVCKPIDQIWESTIWKAKESWSFERYMDLCIK
jgi:hypothetical protein